MTTNNKWEEERFCSKCKKSYVPFSKNCYYCKDCKNEYSRKWRRNNMEKANNSNKKWRDNNKEAVTLYARKYYSRTGQTDGNRLSGYKRRIKTRKLILSHYSNGEIKCACCGEREYEFLCLDHINGGGNIQRKELKLSGIAFYSWLVRNNYPEGFQVLCHNCNMAKGFYGECPHKKENKEITETPEEQRAYNRGKEETLDKVKEVIGKLKLNYDRDYYPSIFEDVEGVREQILQELNNI